MGAKPKRSESRKRQAHIMIRVSEEEKTRIRQKAAMAGYPHRTGTYIRKAVLNYPLRSLVDQYAIDKLLQAKADLGRLGGLFKLWLAKSEDCKASAKLGEKDYETVEELVNAIEKRQGDLLQIAAQLMKSVKRQENV